MRVLVCCLLAGWAANALAANPLNSLQNLQSKHRELQQQFRTDLEGIVSLAAPAVREDVESEVQHRLEWLASAEHRRSPLPKEVQAEIPLSLPSEERAWRMQLKKAETDYAQQLYLLSRRVLYAKFPGFAFQLVREAATFDPDHAQDEKNLAAAYADPAAMEAKKLFPGTSLEFSRPTATDVVGFIVCVLICFAIIAVAIWMANIGA